MLIALSPDLVALVTDDIVDKDEFEQLLQIGFSTPAFEQVRTSNSIVFKNIVVDGET